LFFFGSTDSWRHLFEWVSSLGQAIAVNTLGFVPLVAGVSLQEGSVRTHFIGDIGQGVGHTRGESQKGARLLPGTSDLLNHLVIRSDSELSLNLFPARDSSTKTISFTLSFRST